MIYFRQKERDHRFGRSIMEEALRANKAFLIAQLVKNPSTVQETPVGFLGREYPLEKGWATHCSNHWPPLWLRQYRIYLQCRRPGFDPWVGKIPWRRVWQPTPVFLLGESPWTEQPGGLQYMGSQRVGHD